MANNIITPSGTAAVLPRRESVITEQIMAHIRATAKTMVGHCNFGICDFEDICQDLALAVVRAAGKYDPEKSGYYTYTQTVIRHAKNQIYRRRIRRGLDNADTPVDSIDPDDPILIDGNAPSPAESLARRERAEKVRETMAKLPAELRKVAAMLSEGRSAGEIVDACGITYSQYYHRILPALRRAFGRNQEDF